MSSYWRLITVVCLPILIVSAYGCGQAPEKKQPAAPPVKKTANTRLTEAEVIKMAEATARSNGQNLQEYNMKGCHYEFTRPDHTWTVFFERKPPTPPGGHFSVWVDDKTKKASYMPGE